MKCDEIQPLLFDYMARELGDARSAFVREHLRRCAGCRQAAAEIQATLSVLRAASGSQAGVATSLSDDRRRHIRWAVAHPVLDWIYVHHVVVSIGVALAVLLVLAAVLRHTRMFRRVPETGPTIVMFADGTWGVMSDAETNQPEGVVSNVIDHGEP